MENRRSFVSTSAGFLITDTQKSWQKKNPESNVSSPKSRQEQKSYNYPPQSPLVTFARLFSDQKKGSLSRKWWWNDQGFKRSAWYTRKMRGRADEAATVLLKIKLQKIGHSRHCREPFLALGYNVWKMAKKGSFLKVDHICLLFAQMRSAIIEIEN